MLDSTEAMSEIIHWLSQHHNLTNLQQIAICGLSIGVGGLSGLGAMVLFVLKGHREFLAEVRKDVAE